MVDMKKTIGFLCQFCNLPSTARSERRLSAMLLFHWIRSAPKIRFCHSAKGERASRGTIGIA